MKTLSNNWQISNSGTKTIKGQLNYLDSPRHHIQYEIGKYTLGRFFGMIAL